MPVNSYCWTGTVSKFMRTEKDEWLSKMKERYERVMPHALTPSIVKSWENCWVVLEQTFRELGRAYNGLKWSRWST